MSGVITHHNERKRQESLDRMTRYTNTISGKEDLLREWEEWELTCGGLNAEDCAYISALRVRIRRQKVLLSHIRP